VDTLVRLGGNDLDGDAVHCLIAGKLINEVAGSKQV
jgi:hypothetical protein